MLNIFKDAVKNTLIYSLGRFSTKLAGFILLPLYTSKLSLAEYGIFGMLEITSQVIVSFLGFHLYYGLMRWYWDKELEGKQKSAFFTVSVFLMIMSLFFVLITPLFAKQLSVFFFEKEEFSLALFLMILNSFLQILIQMPLTLIRIYEKPMLYSFSNIIRMVIVIALTYYFISATSLKVEGIFLAQIIGTILMLFMISKITLENIEVKLEIGILKKFLHFGFPLAISAILGVLLSVTDRYCLRFLSDLETVGKYSLGFKIANTLKVFIISSVGFAIAPLIFKMEKHPQRDLFYSRLTKYYSLGLMLIILPISVFAKEIIQIIAHNNPAYWDSYKIIPIICFAIFFGMLKDNSSNGLLLRRKTKIIPLLVLFVSILNLLMNMIMIPLFGFIGAALSSLISQIIFFLIIHFKAQKEIYIDYKMNNVIKILVMSVLIIVISYAFTSYKMVLLYKTITLLSIIPMLILMKFFDMKEIKALSKLIRLNK